MREDRGFLEAYARHLDAQRGRITDRIVDETARAVPGYAGVPRADLHAATLETLGFFVAALPGPGARSGADWTFDAETVRRRIRQGVRLSDWYAHTRVFGAVLHEEARSLGAVGGFAEAAVAEGLLRVEELGHAGTLYAAGEFERAEAELLAEDALRRRRYLTALLQGGLAAPAVRDGAGAVGLDPDALHHAVRVRPLGGAAADDVLRRLMRTRPTVGPGAAWAEVDGDVAGVTPDAALPELPDAVAGVGPAVPLGGVPGSYAAATTALETAYRLGRRGPHRLEDLGALPVAVGAGRTGDALVERLVDRVERHGAHGPDLVATVAAYLEHGLRAGPAAEALHLHPNSLRKRLRRYEELAGVDLGRIDDVAALWVALRRREASAPTSAAAAR